MKRMKIAFWLVAACALTAALATTALALTIEQEVTPAYVRDHSNEFSVTVSQGQGGLIQFRIKHAVPKPMYHVAHLAVYHQGKLMATSDTPSYGQKRGNTFWLSLAAEDIAESKFELSDSALAGSGDEALPVVGTCIHQFRLLDFVPEQMRKAAPIK